MRGAAITWVARRFGSALLTFFGITLATFILIHAVPGDPIAFYLSRSGPAVSPASLQSIRHEYHLDEPLPAQYLRWLRGVLLLDFGRSTVDRRDVADRIGEKLPATFALNVGALLLAALVGLPIGLWSAVRSGARMERVTAALLFLVYSLPSFWVALLLMEWLSVRLGILPLFGMLSDDYATMTTLERIADRLRHFALPVITLAYAQIAIFARFASSAVSEVISQDFIVTARAKGARESTVILRHAFRNALIPIITLLGLTVPTLISGSVIVETIFQWDGVGRLYYDSILARDYPTVLGLTVATAVITLLASVIADLAYAIADPRVRVSREVR